LARILIVRGGWDGGWYWKRPAQELRTRGHEVYTPAVPHGLTRHWEEPLPVVGISFCAGFPVFAGHRNAPVRFSPTKEHASHILLPIDRIGPIGKPLFGEAPTDITFQLGYFGLGRLCLALSRYNWAKSDYGIPLMTFRQPLCYSSTRMRDQ
jgi:hypothetical protein